MSYFRGILRPLGQKPGQEEETIQTLSNRLQHATMAADRKLAVLGLKSFSRQFRETVVQYGLRGLLQTLGKDTDNAPLVKAVLETLLNLFFQAANDADTLPQGWILSQSRVQNGKYPSPLLVEPIGLDEFLQWIADEMILTPAHVQSLMLVLQQHLGFQIRLCALQLLEAVVATRPTRAKECVLNIPLAVATVVGVLDDPNDPVRNEAILLLMALVNNNYNIQKLVAFENTFLRIFAIIEEEGGIRGSILVQDCMTLLYNLLMYNASNQTFFLETDCVPQLASLIAEPLGVPDTPQIVWTDQRLLNMAILLDICRSFVDPQNQHLAQNQLKLQSSGIFLSILQLVFSPVMENPVRKAALQVTGDIISNNAELQLQFAHIDVPYIDPSMPLLVQSISSAVPAPLALLNWALVTNSVHVFEVRLAAVHCLAKFFRGNTDAKTAFLSDQINAAKNPAYYSELKQAQDKALREGETEPSTVLDTEDDSRATPYANIFTILTTFDFDVKLNPYSAWFSAITLVHLISDCPETRQLAREVKVGSAEDGEEEMSSIQAIAGMLVANLENADPRIAVGYFVLLTLWLYEDFEAVNDFLSDASSIKAILVFLSKNSTESSEIVQGMGAVLVGVCYDFCTKSAPFPRANLYELITKSLGADSYTLKVKKFKNNQLFKQFDGDLESDFEKDASGLPNLFFIPEYVELVKDNYYRIRKSLSRGPNFEPRSRISFEIFEELEGKNVELKNALEDLKLKAEKDETNLKTRIEESETQLKNSSHLLESCKLEVKEARRSEEELIGKIETFSKDISSLEADKKKFESSSAYYTSEYHKLLKKSALDEESLKQLKQKLSEADSARQKAEDGINKMSRELFQLTKQKKESDSKVSDLEKELVKLGVQHEKSLRECQSMVDESRKTNEKLRTRLTTLENQQRLSSGDEISASKLRDFQIKVSEMEGANDDLMVKLRSAASVVLQLRSDKARLQDEKHSLQVELVESYEEIETFSRLLEDVEKLGNECTLPGQSLVQQQSLESYIQEKEAILEDKKLLENYLSQSMKEIESLQATIANERATFEQERKTAKVLSSEESELTDPANEKSVVPEPSVSRQTEAGCEKLTEDKDVAANDGVFSMRSLQEEIGLLHSKIKDSENTHKLEIADYKEKMSELKKQHQEILAEHEQLKELHKEKRSDESLQQGGHHSTENEEELGKQVDDQATELAISLKRIEDLENNIEVLSESASSSLISFKKSQDFLKARINELEESKKQLLEEIDEREKERTKIIQDFQEAYDELDSSYMDLELLLTNLEKHKDELEKQLKKFQDESTQKIEKLNLEREALTKSLSDVRTERDNLRREYYELEKLSNIIGSELKAKEALLQAMSNKGADLAAKDKIVIEIKEKLASTIAELGDSVQKLRLSREERSDLQKLFDENIALLEKSKSKVSDLENQLASKSQELEKCFDENRKIAVMQKNLSETTKANVEYSNKIESLENEISSLKVTLSEVNRTLDEQRKLNCDTSLTAALEYTENSTKLERSIIKNQDAYDKELEKMRLSTQTQIQAFKEKLAALKEENARLSEKALKSEKLSEETQLKNDKNDETIQVTESLRKELWQVNQDLKIAHEKLFEKDADLESKEAKLEESKAVHEEQNRKHATHIHDLKAQIMKWETNASEQKEAIKRLTEEKERLQQVIEDYQGVIKQKEEEEESLNQTILREDSSALNASQSTALPETLCSDKLEAVKDLYEGAEAKLCDTNLEIEKQAELLVQAQNTIEELEQRIEKQETLHAQGDMVSGLKRQIEELENELQFIKQNRDEATRNPQTGGERDASRPQEGPSFSAVADDEVSVVGLQKEIELLARHSQKEQQAHMKKCEELETLLKQKCERLSEAEAKVEEEHEKLMMAEEELAHSQRKLDDSTRAHDVSWKVQLQESAEHLCAKENEVARMREEIRALSDKLEEAGAAPTICATEPSKSAERENGDTETQNDFEDLMLLCEHQERKIERYKRRLRALDIVVSSDDSDGEDLL